MSALFRDARLKIDRANKHIADVEAAIAALKQEYTSTTKMDSDARAKVLIHEVPNLEDALLKLSLIVGDALHNLHTALDFAWASVIERRVPSAKSSKTKFPVRETRQQVEACLHGIKVDTLCPALFDCIISTVQPYKGGQNDVVFALHDLDISDKHITLLEMMPTGSIRGVDIRDANGHTWRGSGMPAQGFGPYTIAFEDSIQIENKGELSVDVAIKEAGIFNGLSVLSLLSSFSNFVLYTVKLLENI